MAAEASLNNADGAWIGYLRSSSLPFGSYIGLPTGSSMNKIITFLVMVGKYFRALYLGNGLSISNSLYRKSPQFIRHRSLNFLLSFEFGTKWVEDNGDWGWSFKEKHSYPHFRGENRVFWYGYNVSGIHFAPKNISTFQSIDKDVY